jgi:hypothetical protein
MLRREVPTHRGGGHDEIPQTDDFGVCFVLVSSSSISSFSNALMYYDNEKYVFRATTVMPRANKEREEIA